MENEEQNYYIRSVDLVMVQDLKERNKERKKKKGRKKYKIKKK